MKPNQVGVQPKSSTKLMEVLHLNPTWLYVFADEYSICFSYLGNIEFTFWITRNVDKNQPQWGALRFFKMHGPVWINGYFLNIYDEIEPFIEDDIKFIENILEII